MKALPLLLLLGASTAALTLSQDGPGVGYTDTPQLPEQPWRVHDKERPRPPVVAPGEGPHPPSDAIILFDGEDIGPWETTDGTDARWTVQDREMSVNDTGAIRTRQAFGDIQLHLEWRSPEEVNGESQGRGNSGVFLMERYEIQILDSYENPTYADGQAASMYGQYPPDVNACRGPGEWQSYDIIFRAPVFEGEELRQPAVVTVLHNGVLVHHERAFLGSTTHRALPAYSAHDALGKIQLQDHGNPVSFRNIWVREL